MPIQELIIEPDARPHHPDWFEQKCHRIIILGIHLHEIAIQIKGFRRPSEELPCRPSKELKAPISRISGTQMPMKKFPVDLDARPRHQDSFK